MSTPTLTPALFCQILDTITAGYLDATGDQASGYGLGDPTQPLASDWGLSGGLRGLILLVTGSRDPVFTSKFNGLAAVAAGKSGYKNVLKGLVSPVVVALAQACYSVGIQLSVASIVDIPSFIAYYNIGAGGPWSGMAPPQFQGLFQLVYTSATLPPTAFYAPPLTDMGSLTVGGSFVAGSTVDTTQYAGEARIEATVSSFAGTGGSLTVVCNSLDANGNPQTGRDWTGTITGNGTVALTPVNAGDICTAVTAINLPGGMTGGTVAVSGLPPSGRTYPPTA